MFGKNPKRSLETGDGSNLKIQNIFKTIQGEAINAGVPAIFIRLGGCNLACDFCDTEFEDFASIEVNKIVSIVSSLSLNSESKKSIELVVITGGEPFRQPIEQLCKLLIHDNFLVQIETNGTLFRNIPNEVEIICSPKNINGKYTNIRPDLLKRITALKFLISVSNTSYSQVPDLGQIEYNIPVFVQPMDEYNKEKNKQNKLLTVEKAMNNGYRVSYQIHKELGIE